MKRLNGWQRLWVVVSGALAVAAIAFGLQKFEMESQIDQNYQWKVEHLKEIRRALLNPKPNETKNKYSYAENWTVDGVEDEISAAGIQYEKDLKMLPSEQTKAVLVPLILWLLASGILYLIGWAIGWIYRGFRPQQHGDKA